MAFYYHGFKTDRTNKTYYVNREDLEVIEESEPPPPMDAETAIKTPPFQWRKLVASLSEDDLRKLDESLANTVEHYGRLALYVQGIRRNYSHEKAVDHSNAFVNKIRKILGFAYPSSLNF